MNDIVRGLVLLSSVLLWLPFLRPTLDGTLALDGALLRYAGTLLLAWAGGAGLSALVRGYAAQGEQSATGAEARSDRAGAEARSDRAGAESRSDGAASGEHPRRRAEDHAS